MEYFFFYGSVILVMIALAASSYLREIRLEHIVIGIATTGYSLVFDTIMGKYLGLYHYINPSQSVLYMTLSAVLVYPPINMVYTLFLPKGRRRVILYTSSWIIIMLAFEYASVVFGTVVFTGWRPVPWSFVTYITVYSWMYALFSYVHRNRKKRIYTV